MNWVTYVLIQSTCWQNIKKPKHVHKEREHMFVQGAEFDPAWKPERFFPPYLWFWRLNKTYHPRHPKSSSTELASSESREFCRAANGDRQVDWCTGADSCTCRKEFTPSGSWAAPEPRRWRTGGWVIDEDVRLQMDHQISGLVYLMLWCNQSPSLSPNLTLSPNVRPQLTSRHWTRGLCNHRTAPLYSFFSSLSFFSLNAVIEDSL